MFKLYRVTKILIYFIEIEYATSILPEVVMLINALHCSPPNFGYVQYLHNPVI